MTGKEFLQVTPMEKGTKLYTKTSTRDANEEIIDIIQAIENKKSELQEAELIIQFHPKIINNLEQELFKKLKEIGS